MNDTSNLGVNNTGVNTNPVPNMNPMPAGGVNPSVPAQQPAQVNPGVAMPSPAVSVPQQPVASPSVQVPVQPQVAPTPVAPQAPTTPEQAPDNSNVQIQMSSGISASTIMEEPKKDSKRDKNANKVVNDGEESSDDLTGQNANRAPIMVVVIFFAFLLAAFIYYYIIMTPTKVYSKAFDNIFNGIKENIRSIKDSDKNKFKIDLGFDLDTNQEAVDKYAPQLGKVDYIDNDYLEGIINIDKKKNDIKVTLRSEKRLDNLKKLGLEDMIEDSSKETQEMLDFSIYMVDGQTYIGPIDYINYNDIKEFGTRKIQIPKPIKLDIFEMIGGGESNFNTDIFDIEKIESIYTLLEMTKDKVIGTLEEKELSRSIGVARIGGTTAIALKSSAYVEKDKIKHIHEILFDDALADKTEHANDKDFKVIDELMLITGASREEIIDKLKELRKRDSLIDKVEVNLYMNLANTELISLYVRVDEKYTFQIDYLNGYYQFHIDIVNDKKQKAFVIDATYDEVNGIVDGLGYIENDNTIVGVKFDYKRTLNKEGRKTGNSLIFKFYNNDTFRNEKEEEKIPLAILKCNLEVYDDPETTDDDSLNFNLEEDVKTAAQGIGRYGSDLNKFKTHFISHIDFLVDHLLYNKGDAAANRKKLGDETGEIKDNDTKVEETKPTETETKEETSSTETETTETGTTTTEENTTTEETTSTETTTTENSENAENGTPE